MSDRHRCGGRLHQEGTAACERLNPCLARARMGYGWDPILSRNASAIETHTRICETVGPNHGRSR